MGTSQWASGTQDILSVSKFQSSCQSQYSMIRFCSLFGRILAWLQSRRLCDWSEFSPQCAWISRMQMSIHSQREVHQEVISSKQASQFRLRWQEDGCLKLKKNHNYFYQVQSLGNNSTPVVQLVVWSPKELHVEQVQADPKFWEGTLPKLRKFYDMAILRKLASLRHPWQQPIWEPTELRFAAGWLNS